MHINNEDYTRNPQLRRLVREYNKGEPSVHQDITNMASADSHRYSTTDSSNLRSIPIQAVQPSLIDENLRPEELHLRRVYESATWRMYNRIMTSRRRVCNGSVASGASDFSSANGCRKPEDDDQIMTNIKPLVTHSRTPELYYAEDDDSNMESHHVIHDNIIDDKDEDIFDLELET
jgi:hypothetical protein